MDSRKAVGTSHKIAWSLGLISYMFRATFSHLVKFWQHPLQWGDSYTAVSKHEARFTDSEEIQA